MARPSKPALSQAEWAAIVGEGDRAASGIVSELRGANVGSISQREASRRRVSHEWVAQQRKRQKTQPSENGVGAGSTQPSENPLGVSHSASRMTRMGYSVAESNGEVARVEAPREPTPAKDQVVAKGPDTRWNANPDAFNGGN